MLPNVKARMRNSGRWNIGSATRVSITQKAGRTATPPMSAARTMGFVHPIVSPP